MQDKDPEETADLGSGFIRILSKRFHKRRFQFIDTYNL